MKQEVGRIKDRIAGGIKAKLDALSPKQRLHVVIGMFGILVVLFLYCTVPSSWMGNRIIHNLKTW